MFAFVGYHSCPRTAFGLAASCGLLGLSEDPDLLKASRPVLPWTQVGFVEKKRKNAKQVSTDNLCSVLLASLL